MNSIQVLMPPPTAVLVTVPPSTQVSVSGDIVTVVTPVSQVTVTTNVSATTVVTPNEQGPPGPQGTPGLSGGLLPTLNFSYGDATPTPVATLAAGTRVFSVTIFLDVAPAEYVIVAVKNIGTVTTAGVITILVTFDSHWE